MDWDVLVFLKYKRAREEAARAKEALPRSMASHTAINFDRTANVRALMVVKQNKTHWIAKRPPTASLSPSTLLHSALWLLCSDRHPSPSPAIT